ncbi:MAG: TfoX/Sxy family protein [Candidatus Manganitrophus sp.]|nr:TfoX/Sxy family protein [Candidatus Manganitrophus sp.]WDT70373.1 MAG: TfoX/Sxy family protein [Candidatus Manganitrophus sp.]
MKDESFREFVLDQLSPLEGIHCRPMFGGQGLYRDGHFFGILFKGRLYFKTDDASRSDYVEMGMKPFRPSAQQTLKTYYEVPVDVLEDPEQLKGWAERAIACQAEMPRWRKR